MGAVRSKSCSLVFGAPPPVSVYELAEVVQSLMILLVLMLVLPFGLLSSRVATVSNPDLGTDRAGLVSCLDVFPGRSCFETGRPVSSTN